MCFCCAAEDINSGSVYVLIKYRNLIPIMNKSYDLCDDIVSYLGVSCPLEAGTHEYTITETIPSYAFSVSLILVQVILLRVTKK